MNLGQMREQVQAWLGLQDITSYDETGFIDDKLYQGTIDMLARTRCIVRCVQLNVNADVAEYVLDQKILSLVDVENGNRRRLRRDQLETDNYDPGVVVGYGPADGWPTSPYGFTLIRSDLLRIVPTPSEDGSVQVWAVLKPTQMSQDSDSPSDEIHGAIPEEYHDAIVSYTMWKLADYADDGATQNGEYYRVLYEGQNSMGGRLAQIRISVNKRGTARGTRSRVRLRRTSPSGTFI